MSATHLASSAVRTSVWRCVAASAGAVATFTGPVAAQALDQPPQPARGSVPPSITLSPEQTRLLQSQIAARSATPMSPASRADRGPGIVNTVVVVDPAGPLAPFVSQIEKHAKAAGDEWSRFLVIPPGAPGPRTITISVALDPFVTRAGGRSATTGFVANRAGYNIFEQGQAFEIRTGIDPNGATSDVEITFEPDYFFSELWFDAAPVISPRSQPVNIPSDKTDAFSVFVHEIGHALAFNGWMDWSTGELPLSPPDPAAYRSPFDELTLWSGDEPFFLGAHARAAYRQDDVPLTVGNVFHLGNASGQGLGSDLVPDLMNGVVFARGVRYTISRIDLSLLRDLGISVQACDADVDRSGALNVQDIFSFLAIWFAGDLEADFNTDGETSVQDIFDFLTAWFGGC
jgi:hypothetical protein